MWSSKPVQSVQVQPVVQSEQIKTPIVHKCDKCSTECKSAGGLTLHKKSCGKPKFERISIPKTMKRLVWIQSYGMSLEGECLCCKRQIMFDQEWDCGHIIAVANGGETKMYNLRPLCQKCNRSMGSMNMNDFIAEYNKFRNSELKQEHIENITVVENMDVDKSDNSEQYDPVDELITDFVSVYSALCECYSDMNPIIADKFSNVLCIIASDIETNTRDALFMNMRNKDIRPIGNWMNNLYNNEIGQQLFRFIIKNLEIVMSDEFDTDAINSVQYAQTLRWTSQMVKNPNKFAIFDHVIRNQLPRNKGVIEPGISGLIKIIEQEMCHPRVYRYPFTGNEYQSAYPFIHELRCGLM